MIIINEELKIKNVTVLQILSYGFKSLGWDTRINRYIDNTTGDYVHFDTKTHDFYKSPHCVYKNEKLKRKINV